MQDFGDIIHNQILLASLIASFVAQLLKLTIDYGLNHKLNIRVLVETGGMPSSHAATVTALATSVGQVKGWGSVEFAIATVFAVIVMYDAAGVRQAAGKQARILNQIIDEVFYEHQDFNEERLKELLGHTPKQVIVGSILGITIAYLIGPDGLMG